MLVCAASDYARATLELHHIWMHERQVAFRFTHASPATRRVSARLVDIYLNMI